MEKKLAYLIGFVVLAELLTACGGGAPNDSMVQTAIANTQQASSGVVPTSELPAQSIPTDAPAATQGVTAQADITFIPFHVSTINSGDGWVKYSVLIAIQYNGSTPITVYDDNSSGGGYREIDEQGFKGYVIPPHLDFVITTDGNTYPVSLNNYCGDRALEDDMGWQMATSFPGIENTRLLPDSILVSINKSLEIISTFGACFQVPETLSPSQIILMTSETASQTIDFNQIPAEYPVNFEPDNIKAVPVNLKMSDFEIAISDFQLSGSENDEITYQARISIKNTVLTDDRIFRCSTVYAISNEGLLFRPEDFSTALPEDDLYYFTNKKIGPGQTAEGTINFSIPQSQTIPSQLYFYVITRDNQWFSFKAALPTP